MRAHLVYEGFLRFLDALPAANRDPWQLYQELYLAPNRPVLEAWWEQCIGRPRAVWRERVRRVRPEDYGQLREIAEGSALIAMARDIGARCLPVAPLPQPPEAYFLVGFFSPEGFAFQVEDRWSVGVGMERLRSPHLLPVLLAHEYGHCYRRALGHPRSLGEHLVDEGFAVETAARALPERPLHDHLLMKRGEPAILLRYQEHLWRAIEPILPLHSPALVSQVVYGRGETGTWPVRAGAYLGWRMVREFLYDHPGRFDASADDVIRHMRRLYYGWREPWWLR